MRRNPVIDAMTSAFEVDEIQPIGDYVLVEVLERNRSKIGLILPAKEKTECLYGRVLATGPGETHQITGQVFPLGVKPGDIVMSVQYMGEKVQAIGKKYKLIRDHGIWAKLTLTVRSEFDWDIDAIAPYRDHVLLRMDSEEHARKGGKLLMPSNPQFMYRAADVLKVGPGYRRVKADRVSPVEGIKPGDQVVCMRYAGCIVRLGKEDLRLASEEDCEAVVTDGLVDVMAGQDRLAKPVDDYEVIPESHLDELNRKTVLDSGGKMDAKGNVIA